MTNVVHVPEKGAPYVVRTEEPSAAPTGLQRRLIGESEEAYPMVVVSLSDKLRIVDCRDQMQWIVQKRQSGRWLGISYHRCRDVMIERWCSGADTMALSVLMALPSFHKPRKPTAMKGEKNHG
jgi:hypothetical protein